MANTKLFKNGNSQAVRIPADLAYSSWNIDLVIERHGDELRIRPAKRRMGDVLGKLSQFSEDFMSEGRVRIPANVTVDSGNVTGVPMNVTDDWCCAF